MRNSDGTKLTKAADTEQSANCKVCSRRPADEVDAHIVAECTAQR